MSKNSVFEGRGKGQLEQSLHDLAARIAEAERRTEQQERLIESMAAAGQDTKAVNFDLSRMYLLLAVLQEFGQRAPPLSLPPRQTASR